MFVLNQNIKGGGNITTLNAFNKRTQTNFIGAAIGAASSLVGGAMAQHSQAEANKTNLEIARETNASNQQLAEKQNQWNIDQWNRENDYNTASAQKQRMIDAGMNPMFGDVSAGTAQSVQSAPLANQQLAHVEPEDAFAKSVGYAGQSAFQNLMTQQLTVANVRKANADADTAETQAALNKIGAQRQLGTMPFDIEQAKNLSLNSKQTNELLRLQTENQNVANYLQAKYGETFNIAELENLAANKLKTVSERHVNEANIGKINSETLVNEATIGKIASEVARNYAESKHLNADTNTINAIRSYVVQDYKLNNIKSAYENNVLQVNSDWQQKHGSDALDQQLDAAKFENGTFNRYVKPFVPAAGAVAGGVILKGKGKSNGSTNNLVRSIRQRSSFYSGND